MSEKAIKEFNPFYDSKFLISFEDRKDVGRRLLVELYSDELVKLKKEIEYVLNSMMSPSKLSKLEQEISLI